MPLFLKTNLCQEEVLPKLEMAGVKVRLSNTGMDKAHERAEKLLISRKKIANHESNN